MVVDARRRDQSSGLRYLNYVRSRNAWQLAALASETEQG